jgi:hypothetical protein
MSSAQQISRVRDPNQAIHWPTICAITDQRAPSATSGATVLPDEYGRWSARHARKALVVEAG